MKCALIGVMIVCAGCTGIKIQAPPMPPRRIAQDSVVSDVEVSGAAAVALESVTISWRNMETNMPVFFNIYGSESLEVPMSRWPLLYTTWNTNITIPVTKQQEFFGVKASNTNGQESEWGRE